MQTPITALEPTQMDLSPAQQEALFQFKAQGFPHAKLEEWKYTSFKDLQTQSWNWKPASVFSHQGLQPMALSALLEKSSAFKNLWESKQSLLDQNSLYPLNEALHGEALVFWASAGAQKLDLNLALDALPEGSIINSKLIVFVDQGASLSIVEQVHAKGSQRVFSNYVQEIFLAADAHLHYVKSQDISDSMQQVDQTFVHLSDRAKAHTFTFSINGGVLRNNLHFYIQGSGAEAHLNGLYVPAGKQLMDNHTVVDHRVAQAESNELYKGVLMGHATGVFNGKIFVRQDAQQTNAFQSCKNVLASANASMNTKPQLEIWADDVKCSHGTTTGQLSEEALFYLRSRGISLASAKTLLLLAFVQELIDRIEDESLHASLSEKIISKIQQSLA